jgi:hypothetical protein
VIVRSRACSRVRVTALSLLRFAHGFGNQIRLPS